VDAKTKLIIIGGIFAVSSVMIVYVALNKSSFWLLIPGAIGIIIFGPWAYYLRAKASSHRRSMTDEEIIAQAKLEQTTKDKEHGKK
jgi:multisubunit Na+/H+ antiporter MnhG subunit